MKSRFEKQQYQHDDPDKFAILLTNLGTPEAATPKALRTYLAQFLADRRVVEIPRFLWMIILHGIILRIRPARSAKAYATVWTERGSPLMYHTQDQADKLRERLQKRFGDKVLVDFAMRYGNPSVSNRISDLLNKGARKLCVLPLYPQYSGSTTGSTFDAIAHDFTERRWLPELRFINHYHHHPVFIKTVAQSIRDHWDKHGKADKLVLSYHGVPLKYLHDGDPYHCQCRATTRLIAQELKLPEDAYMTTFQSRFGKATWLQPYTDKTLMALPEKGVKSVQVVCPGFSSDCLETIEEIGEENREYFMENGGERFEYIAALNATDAHIDFIEQLVLENIQGWETTPETDPLERQENFKRCPFNH